jgi:hypothetical protein
MLRTPTWPILFVVFFMVQNIHESDLVRLGTFMWIPFVATSVALALTEARSPLLVVARREKRHVLVQQAPGNPEQGIPIYES